ncbi:PAS domain S-box protein [Pseudaestuariivita atlantica]|uniref:Sensor protein FixL n=1 Tax=Pseudaestuariivita atlantica TaxID=1317121 RepID=A0A0L1JJI6_9RHOB|nr:PAS domain S-box protein [Pseudaestuariivita atlantica]KNG91872.1 FixL [Pseudaestuariivita atlantica]
MEDLLADTKQSGLLFDALMEAAVDAIIVSDANGTMIRANKAASKLFGHEIDEMVGRTVNMLMPEALAALHDDFMTHHIETGEKRIIGLGRDVEGLRKDGSVFPLHLSVGHTEVAGERLFIGILHDLTERRAAQDALARSQRLDAIGQLTGGIAHDFNNLLTVVIGNLELLEMRGADDRQLRLIRDSLESAEMGADLTSRLLVFAKKGNLKPVRADLRTLCEDTLAILQRTIGEIYSIKTDFAEDLSDVLIDPVQLQSALINLALNARDAMPKGGEFLISVADVVIDDTYMAQETDIEPGQYVRLFVSDDGEGMGLEAQRRAFEPFFTTKSETGGSGLGLAMVYGFVRQSGGHITLYSEPGHGTSFGLYFPILSSDDGKVAATIASSAALEKGSGEVVLVVEDNPKVRRLSVERVRDLGYETLEAENGDIALDLLQSGARVDLVFSDVVMPGALNGYDLAAKVDEQFPAIKVLLTSGYASDVVTGRLGGTSDYEVLHKPYRQAELGRRLQALFEPTSSG